MRLPPTRCSTGQLLVAARRGSSPSTPSRGARSRSAAARAHSLGEHKGRRRRAAESEDGLAGEGDVLPAAGLSWPSCRVAIVAAASAARPDAEVVVRLGNSATGWGTGARPSTRLCLEFLSEQPSRAIACHLTHRLGRPRHRRARPRGRDRARRRRGGGSARRRAGEPRAQRLRRRRTAGRSSSRVREIAGGLAPPADICVANILILPAVGRRWRRCSRAQRAAAAACSA